MRDRIFLSHSSSDKDAIRQLAEDLKRAGLDVWLDEWEILAGDLIIPKIQEGLQSAKYLAVWLTNEAVKSKWVGSEWQNMHNAEISSESVTVIPLLAEDCPIPFFLRDKKYADFRKDYTHGLIDVLQAVRMGSWENKLGMKFSLIMPGAFLMGSKKGERIERPVHQVSINRPFYMGTFAITQSQWINVMNTKPWQSYPKFREGDDYPATAVTWYEVQEFLNKLSFLDAENSYYLPTEEEWEYAARAGTITEFSFGDDERDLRLYGWYRDITQQNEEYPHLVGTKKPNPWGLYDMHGNHWEWMDNWYYGSYSEKPKLHPIEKVLRGGAWDYPAYGARSAFRMSKLPSRTDNTVGFRLIRKSF